jgi:mono/diheme cytochrome c family protein
MKPPLLAWGFLSAALALVSCSSARRSEPILGRAPAAHLAFSEGRRVFLQHCHVCHPGGEAGLGPALNNKPAPAALIKFQVRHGLGTMPAFKEDRIGPAELDALAAYLVALRREKT